MSLLRGLAITLCVSLAIVLVAEFALGVAGFRPATREVPARLDKFRPDGELVWTLAANWSGNEPNGSVVRTDAHGHRVTGASGDPGEHRGGILFLGDSVTYGHHVDDDETVPHALEVALAARTGHRIPVVNAAVPGYSTFQEAALFRREAARAPPDVVLLGFSFNDVTERYTSLAGFGGERFFMWNVDTTVGQSLPSRVWQRSALRTGLARLVASSAERGELYRVTRLWEEPEPAEIGRAWERVYAEIDGLSGDVRASGARLAVVIYPHAFQVTRPDASRRAQDRIVGHLRRTGVAYVDLLPAMRSAAPLSGPLFLDANHLTPEGAELAGERIADFVLSSKLVP